MLPAAVFSMRSLLETILFSCRLFCPWNWLGQLRECVGIRSWPLKWGWL
jgi:hypothetical protein